MRERAQPAVKILKVHLKAFKFTQSVSSEGAQSEVQGDTRRELSYRLSRSRV